ncbi:MAG: hypothetical protein J6B11_00870 [Spirochaetales bacterium]|nr:hypothetical protein [Spirochaetales bacterium]
MKKKWLFLIPALFVLAGCGVERLNNAISKGFDDMKSPSWDLDFDVPVGKVKAQLSKIQEVNDMLEELKFTDNADLDNGESALIHVKINDMTIDGSTFDVDPSVNKALGLNETDNVLTWPLPIGSVESPEIDDASFPVIKLDLDGDAVQDMMLTALKSTDGFLKIKMEMQIKDSADSDWRPAKEEEYFNEAGQPYVAIEDVEDAEGDCYAIKVGSGKFSFKPGVYEGGKLVFETSNFLTSYKEAITPEPMQIKDSEGNVTESETDFEYRISIPKDAFKIIGRSFSIIEDLLEGESESRSYSRSRALSRGGSGLSAKEIKDLIKSADGKVTVLEKMLDDGVTLEEVAKAYDGNLDEVLTDSGVGIADIMASEVIASPENIKILGSKENGFGDYEFIDGTTLGAIEDAENLQSFADFCKFYKKKSIAGIKFSFEVEVDLGENFMVTAEFIKDYEISVDTGDSLPFSKLGSILDRATLEANVKHNFMCEMKIKEPKIANSTMKISGIKETGNGFYAIPEDPCRILFNLDEMPTEDGGLDFTMLIPEDKEVDIALNPTEETDLWIEMELGANGVLKVDAEEISNIMGGE